MKHRVDIADAAEAEAEAAYLWMSQFSPERAGRWYEGFLRAVESLAEMPGRCPLAPENRHFEREVRQLLYGRGGNTYRILFTILEAAGDDPPVVRVLHVRHAAQQPLGESSAD
jgi:plasmid stabilization system protein ParE